MFTQVVLIIDSRKELSQKYKKIIQQESYIYPVIANDLDEAITIVETLEPDLILLADSFNEKLPTLCTQIRSSSQAFRPVIVAISKSSYLEDKLNALKSGADDYLSEPIQSEEFSLKIFVHLRRHIEELSDPITSLPIANITYRTLKRAINSKISWAMLYVDIDSLDAYNQIYGDLAADKVLQAYTAIIKSAIGKSDYLGHLNNNNFIIITSPEKSDKIAAFLNYAFDSIAPKFYSEEDSSRGYLILDGNYKVGRKIPLISTSIGVISNLCRNFNDYREAINEVINTYKLAKNQPGSSWVSDKLKICTVESCIDKKTEPTKILIVEPDAALAFLLKTTLEMQGYNIEATNNLNEISDMIQSYNPNLIILDADQENYDKCFNACSIIKKQHSQIKIIISTTIHDKIQVLNAGADLYLPKPYELMTLFNWVDKFLNN